jgi:hypothetical protein
VEFVISLPCIFFSFIIEIWARTTPYIYYKGFFLIVQGVLLFFLQFSLVFFAVLCLTNEFFINATLVTLYRKKLIQDATQEKNHIHKFLQDANIKITTYITDIFCLSGRNLIEALINGELITVEEIKNMVRGDQLKKADQLIEHTFHTPLNP